MHSSVNPGDLVVLTPEIISGFPDRIIAKSDEAARTLGRRTLTALYNEFPEWLRQAHEDLDNAVAHAYGWDPAISDEDALKRLLELNLARA